MSTGFDERPVALIVEDDIATLHDRQRLFDSNGFQSIGAATAEDALREFRSSPTVDIVITDINLIDSDEYDRSGVEVAQSIKARRPQIPVMAVSGKADSLDGDESRSFDDKLLKGTYSVDRLLKDIQKWRDDAIEYRRSKAAAAKSELAQMKEDRPFPDPDIELQRDFLPGWSPLGTWDESGEEDVVTPDEVLKKVRWRLRLVQAGFRLSDFDEAPGTDSIRTQMAIPLWMKQEAGRWIAVLHEHESIYHDAETEEDAVNGALSLMFGYYQRFVEDPDGVVGDDLKHLRDYLNRIFGNHDNASDEARRKEDNAETGR